MIYIHYLTIHKEYRNLRYGYNLMKEFKTYCNTKNVLKSFLFTSSENTPAIKLYSKLNAEKANEDSVYFIKMDN